MDMEFVKADATVTLTLDVAFAMNVMAGIREMEAGWLTSLTEEEHNSRETPHIHAVRILPNHIARAIQKLGEQLSTAKIKL
jgi:hypothetical protein